MDTPNAEYHTPNSASATLHPEPLCVAVKADGQPCRARPIPGSDYCPFHHPDHAAAFAEGRSQGGAAPRRRVRRLPLVLDHLHVAEFLSELMVEAMNAPPGADLRRFQTMATLSRVLLKAVGCPEGYIMVHHDRRDTPPHLPHLRRYDPPAPEPQPEPALSTPAPPAGAGPAAPAAGTPAPGGMLSPALQTLKLYDPEQELRKRVLWLDPDSSLERNPWGPPSPPPAATPPSEGPHPAESPSPAPAEPLPPVLAPEADPAERAELQPVVTPLSPDPAAPLPPAPPGEEPAQPSAQAPDKRWTSAPATSDAAAGDALGSCCEDDNEVIPPVAADAPALPSSTGPPATEPAPQPRRPCIAVVSAPRGAGRLAPWSSDPFPPPW